MHQGGAGQFHLLVLRTHQALPPPRLQAAGIISSLHFDADGKRLAFGFAAANQPRDAYVLDVAENRLEPWTRSEAGAVDVAKFVLPRLGEFPTFDRGDCKARSVPLYLYEPITPRPHPVLI